MLLERRWDLLRKFCLHPGVVLTLALAAGWYAIAVTRGGEGFFDRQILQENLNRFVGGSGHSHPVYYYIPYLFSKSLPWGVFLPILLWDLFRSGVRASGDVLFLKLWFLVMFAFFSISVGKRPVYLLPLYPAVCLLLAAWFSTTQIPSRGRTMAYRSIAAFAVITGFALLVIPLGALWSHDPRSFFTPIEALLKPKDRANVMAVRNQAEHFGWMFTCVVAVRRGPVAFSGAVTVAWADERCCPSVDCDRASFTALWAGPSSCPSLPQQKSYKSFMGEVNQRVKPEDKLYIHGRFNSDPVVFYRGAAIERLNQSLRGLGTENRYRQFLHHHARAPVRSGEPAATLNKKYRKRCTEGDAPLILVQADFAVAI